MIDRSLDLLGLDLSLSAGSIMVVRESVAWTTSGMRQQVRQPRGDIDSWCTVTVLCVVTCVVLVSC